MDDLSAKLQPLRDVMRQHRTRTLQIPGAELSHAAGMGDTWITEMENRRSSENPALSRLVKWAGMIHAQEFGLYIVLNNIYTDVPLLPTED